MSVLYFDVFQVCQMAMGDLREFLPLPIDLMMPTLSNRPKENIVNRIQHIQQGEHYISCLTGKGIFKQATLAENISIWNINCRFI